MSGDLTYMGKAARANYLEQQQRLRALEAQLAEAKAVLRDLGRKDDICPSCDADFIIDPGHAPDCRLAKVLEGET